MRKKITLEDRAEITDLLARYCWHVDEGEAAEWADLWIEDGVFAGIAREPLRGREALMSVPVWALSVGARHKLQNVVMDYGSTDDEMVVLAYNFVTSWLGDAKFGTLALARYLFVRAGDTWKIKSNQVRLLAPADFDTDALPDGFPTPANTPTTWPPLD